MSDLFTGVLPFVSVAEERSFRRAADKLGVSVAAVSKAVRRLEESLGVRLFERTSRSVRLTREGEALAARAREAVTLVRAGREAARAGQREPSGPIVLSLSFILSRPVVPACTRLAQRYEGLTVHLRFTDERVRFDKEGVDAAIRIGPVEDDALVARPLFRPRWVTVASPRYLARHGSPAEPADLMGHRCLKFVDPRGHVQRLRFSVNGEAVDLDPPTALDTNYGAALLDAAVAGVGIAQVFDYMVADAVERGELVAVLGAFEREGPPVHFVYPASRRRSARLRAVLDALREELPVRA